MKTYLLLGALLCSHAQAVGEGYSNFVRQTQQTTGVVWSMPVIPTGSSDSKMLLEEGGSLFQLWTIEQASVKEYLLDQKLVGTYLPKADILIETADPNRDPMTGAQRTRADMPFTVTTTVSGLMSGKNLPVAATKVLLEHHTADFSGSITAMTPAQVISGTPKSAAYIATNGANTLRFDATTLPSPVPRDPAKARGEEHFVVHALSDGSFTQTQIASAHVQVWPAATGGIAGIKDGDRLTVRAPDLTVTMSDVYPGSFTYMQVYEGSQKLGTTGIEMSRECQFQAPVEKSDSRVLTVSSYDEYFPKDGTYTLELITITSFDVVRLAHVTFTVDRALEVRAQLGGLDGE